MGREQRRKEQFKNKNKKIEKEELDTSIKWTTTIKLVCFTLLLLLVIYYVLALFVTKEIDISRGKDEEETSETTDNTNNDTVSNKILAANIFEQKEEEYYVYFYDFDDEDNMVSGVISNLSDDKVYRVDTSSSLNSNYVTDSDGNKDAKDLDDLKVTNPTVIKIEADKIVEYYEGRNKIFDKLSD